MDKLKQIESFVAVAQRGSLTQAAQAVEISAYPDAYAKWQASATAWLALQSINTECGR